MAASAVNFAVVELVGGRRRAADLLLGSNSAPLADQTKLESRTLQEKLMSFPRVSPTLLLSGPLT